jgi:signal transduction histidine kinase
MVRDNVEKIKDLSLDLLHYGKYGRVSARPSDPRGPVEAVLQLLAGRAAELGVALSAEPAAGLASVTIDPEAIQRCLLNLVGNAIDACRGRPGARVAVRILPGPSGGIEYQVTDTGCGMDASTCERLFQSFFSTKGTEGTGIGLMMAKRIVDQHAGRILVESRPGEGTTVTVRLPAVPAE